MQLDSKSKALFLHQSNTIYFKYFANIFIFSNNLTLLTNWIMRFRSANHIFEMTKYLSTSLKLGELCIAETIIETSKAIKNIFIQLYLCFKIILGSAIQTPTSTSTTRVHRKYFSCYYLYFVVITLGSLIS